MICIDTHVLIYAHRAEMKEHKKALKVLQELAEGDRRWALPVFVLGEFIRVVTHHHVFSPPTSIEEATRFLMELLKAPSLYLLSPGERFASLFLEVCRESRVRGNLVFDAQIAALMKEHGLNVILSEDRDFSRFLGLQRHGLL